MGPVGRLSRSTSSRGDVMTLRQRKTVIWLLAGVLAAAAAAIVVAGLVVPVRVETDDGSSAGGKAKVSSAARVTGKGSSRPQRPALADLLGLCRTDFRRPLYDADELAENPKTGKAAAGKRAVRSPLTLQLIGTVNEPGHSMAVFRKRDGSIALCAQGESIDHAGGPVTVTQVEYEKVTVRYGSRSHELVIPPQEQRPTPARAASAKKGK